MKIKFFTFLLLGFLLSSRASMAAQVNAWSIDNSNLVAGRLFLNQTGTTSVTFSVQLFKADGETGTNIQFALATKKADGTVQLLSAINSPTVSDYPTGSLYGSKTVAVTISNSSVINSTVYLVTNFNGFSFSFFSGPYTVTNSSTIPSGAVHWHGTTTMVLYVPVSSEYGATFINTNLNPVLTSGQSMYSSGGAARLTLQTDGNLVIYQVSTGKAVWASQTNGKGAAGLYFQPTDGNLVLRKADGQTPVWSSLIYADGGNMANAQYAFFVLQDDGNFIMMESSTFSYAPSPGNYLVLGDTNSGGFVPSQHFGKIN